MASNPMMNYSLNAGKEFMQNRVQAYIPGVSAFWSSLQYYFNVDNAFVVNKARLLLVPYTNTNWVRSHAGSGGGGGYGYAHEGGAGMGMPQGAQQGGPGEQEERKSVEYAPPIYDVNAPDLYLPLMSLITYVLSVGLLEGTKLRFTPEVLQDVSTTCIVTQVMEVLLIKAGLFVTRSTPIPFLDLIAYTGYKFFGLCINTLVGLLLGSYAYYAAVAATGTGIFVFMVRTLNAALMGSDAGGFGGSFDQPTMRRLYLKFGVALLQVLIMFWLGSRSASS